MSAIGDALSALKAALKLTDDVKTLSETVKAFSREIQELDRRTTCVEARLEYPHGVRNLGEARRLDVGAED